MSDMPCAPMKNLMEQVHQLAPLHTTLLLAGETGTGKTWLARLIHKLSPRRDQPFLVVDCGALAENLMESELFGHVKGAFTGADRNRAGKFAEAGQGTLLLDDIDALPASLQAKLLRAVEERVFEPVGSDRSMTVEARLIAASNRSLEHEILNGRFRSDLYYRLSVVTLALPPLRERIDAIPPLAAHFVAHFAERGGRPIRGIAPEALRVLENYSWPGNIRELRNVIERAVALCPGPEIGLGDLPERLSSPGQILRACTEPAYQPPHPAPVSALRLAGREAEAARILEALRKHGNNRMRAALELGISRKTLYKKLHSYGLMEASTRTAAESQRSANAMKDSNSSS